MKNLKKIMLSLLVGISLTACVPMPDDNMRQLIPKTKVSTYFKDYKKDYNLNFMGYDINIPSNATTDSNDETDVLTLNTKDNRQVDVFITSRGNKGEKVFDMSVEDIEGHLSNSRENAINVHYEIKNHKFSDTNNKIIQLDDYGKTIYEDGKLKVKKQDKNYVLCQFYLYQHDRGNQLTLEKDECEIVVISDEMSVEKLNKIAKELISQIHKEEN